MKRQQYTGQREELCRWDTQHICAEEGAVGIFAAGSNCEMVYLFER